jgi:hypothetical protein
MALIQFPIRGFIIVAGLCLIAFGQRTKFRADEPSDPFRANTVWKGEIVYDKTDYFPESKPYVMILHVQQRKGAEFEGATWYPTLKKNLVKVTGRVGEKGSITFIEEKVIHIDPTATEDRGGVQGGDKFKGQLDKTTIKGSGTWTGPAFNGPVQMRFSLKLAE